MSPKWRTKQRSRHPTAHEVCRGIFGVGKVDFGNGDRSASWWGAAFLKRSAKNKMKKIESLIVKNLNKKSPFLDQCLSAENDKIQDYGYRAFSISVFDHWLSRKEANTELCLFHGAKHESRCQRRLTLFSELAKEAYIHHSNKRHGSLFLSFHSELERCNLYRKSVFEEQLIDLCIPLYGIVLSGGYDYTDHIYYRNESDVDRVKELVKNEGLHCLEWQTENKAAEQGAAGNPLPVK